MKVSLNWLKDYANINVDPKKYADEMTMSGTKVETIEYKGQDSKNIVIGQIKEILPHPDADKLIITMVDVGQSEPLQIVTGASNLSVGDIISVAVDGAKLPNGTKIKKGKLRGVESAGMLCSSEELGIDYKYVDEKSKNGIYILGDEFKVGDNVVDAMGLADVVVEFELTANRSDCRSLIGIAKETAATLDTAFRLPDSSLHSEKEGKVSVHVEVQNQELCSRFVGREIHDIKIAPSPFWLKQRLISYGMRPINNIVDITNYVMIEYGQPLHAYDLDRLTEKKIVVRNANENEKITTLDDIERTLDPDVLLITDGETPLGIAGVMGGAGTQITEETKNIFLEAASFDADSVRLTSRRLGLRTDASSNFEKGIDILRPEAAINRACHLIEQLGAGTVIKDVVDTMQKPFIPTVIETEISTINNLIGEEFPVERIRKILEKLLFEVEINGDKLKVTVPSERIDMSIKEDIVEEVTRIYGYNNIVSRQVVAPVTRALKSRERHFEDSVKQLARQNGLTEIATYSFVSPEIIEKTRIIGEKYHKLLRLLNPLGEETSVMRTTLIPEMLQVAATNLAYKNVQFAAFEYGNTFFDVGEELPYEEKSMVAGIYGEKEDFFTAKSRLEGILKGIGVNAEYRKQPNNPTYHPGRCADVFYKDVHVATLGEIHPLVLEDFGIKKRIYIFELYLKELQEIADRRIVYKPVPRFPAIAKDIALVVDKEKTIGELEKIIRYNGENLLESIELFDIFEGAQIGQNKKSVAFSLVFRSRDRTLTDEEANKVLEHILQKLQAEAGAILR